MAEPIFRFLPLSALYRIEISEIPGSKIEGQIQNVKRNYKTGLLDYNCPGVIREELYNEKDSMKQMREVLHASVQCYKDTEKKLCAFNWESAAGKIKAAKKEDSQGEGIHFALDCMGLIPGIGALFDGINVCWYACEGRWGEAVLSGLALIPAVGIAAGVGKVGGKAGMKAISHADDIAGIAKSLDKLENMSDAAKGLTSVYDPAGVEITWDKSKSRNGQWDMGHIPEAKYSEMHQLY